MSADADPAPAAKLPPLLAEAADRWLERFEAEHGVALPAEFRQRILSLVAISEFAGGTLRRQWPEFRSRLASLDAPPEPSRLEAFAAAIAASDAGEDDVKRELRCFRHRYLTRLLWRDVAGQATVEETLHALSDLADRLLDAAARYSVRQLEARFGRLRNAAGDEVPLVILGMGKLGGRELNFSSDIDIIFLYPEDGESDGRRRLRAQEYFVRLSHAIVSLLDEVTADGVVFRVDTRLRPFGDSGPPVVSFAALESYLLRHGRDWERYAYVKARIVGSRPDTAVAAELFTDIVSPFVYRMYLDYGVFESLRDMHALITAEVGRRELADNIKLGPGGIREIEFIVQSVQLVRGGGNPALRTPELLTALPRMVGSRGLAAGAAAELEEAYRFLRRTENILQAMRDRQTHELPTTPPDRARLAFATGFAEWPTYAARLAAHRDAVARHFDAIALRRDEGTPQRRAGRLAAELWNAGADAAAWADALGEDPRMPASELSECIVAFRNAPATLKADTVARERLATFVPRLIELVHEADDPQRALSRTLAVIDSVLRRSAYIALLNENPLAAERLVRLCERSTWIASQLERFPALLDELLDPGIDAEPVTRAEFDRELDAWLSGSRGGDSEARMERLAQFQRAMLFRIAVADFSGKLPIMKVSDSLTWLAETVIDRALHFAWNDLVEVHGAPHYVLADGTAAAGFGVVAYGKLGGLELSYGSDLDLVFLHDSRGERQLTDGPKPLENTVFFARLVRRLVHFLTTQTLSGVLYDIDTRLRPSGRSGLLVTSTEAFERYQQQNAWTWEHQALLRARPVAGSPAVAAEFERIRATTLVERVRRDTLANDVRTMRERMRRELDKSNETAFDLKQGAGGVGDIEFLVQYLVLANARRHPAVFCYTDNIRQLDALASVGLLAAQEAATLQDIYRRYRLLLHRLSLNDRLPLADAADVADERAFVIRVWKRYFG